MSSAKAQERENARSAVLALDDGYIERSNAGIMKRVLSLPELRAAQRVFAYWSVGRETDTHAILSAALADGKSVALPRTQPGGVMTFAAYTGALVPGCFGIPEPESGPELAPRGGDVMLVPALCADSLGVRLGKGGGYYDRYLAAHPCFVVCLCREALLREKLSREWNDVPVSAVITEKRIIRP